MLVLCECWKLCELMNCLLNSMFMFECSIIMRSTNYVDTVNILNLFVPTYFPVGGPLPGDGCGSAYHM